MMRRSGPRTDPCGTSVKVSLIEDILFSILTVNHRKFQLIVIDNRKSNSNLRY